MMRHKKKLINVLCMMTAAFLLLCSCGMNKRNDIVILYTNDVHCAVEDNIGYAGLAAYQKYMEEKTP